MVRVIPKDDFEIGLFLLHFLSKYSSHFRGTSLIASKPDTQSHPLSVYFVWHLFWVNAVGDNTSPSTSVLASLSAGNCPSFDTSCVYRSLEPVPCIVVLSYKVEQIMRGDLFAETAMLNLEWFICLCTNMVVFCVALMVCWRSWCWRCDQIGSIPRFYLSFCQKWCTFRAWAAVKYTLCDKYLCELSTVVGQHKGIQCVTC